MMHNVTKIYTIHSHTYHEICEEKFTEKKHWIMSVDELQLKKEGKKNEIENNLQIQMDAIEMIISMQILFLEIFEIITFRLLDMVDIFIDHAVFKTFIYSNQYFQYFVVQFFAAFANIRLIISIFVKFEMCICIGARIFN